MDEPIYEIQPDGIAVKRGGDIAITTIDGRRVILPNVPDNCKVPILTMDHRRSSPRPDNRKKAALICVVMWALCELLWAFIAYNSNGELGLARSIAFAGVIVYVYVTIWMLIDEVILRRQ